MTDNDQIFSVLMKTNLIQPDYGMITPGYHMRGRNSRFVSSSIPLCIATNRASEHSWTVSENVKFVIRVM